MLCDELRGRVSYFLTRYHQVHNAYGRASIRLDQQEMVCFSWIEMYRQENDLNKIGDETGRGDTNDLILKNRWDASTTYCDMDFLSAAISFLQMSITDALSSEDFIVQIFAIMDRRVGKRTLQKIKESGVYQGYPSWVKQFFDLRLGAR